MSSLIRRLPTIDNVRFWLLSIFLFKLFLFVIMTFEIHANRGGIQGIFASEGDTFGYFNPIRNWVDGLGYGAPCRMPGLLPIFAPLYFFFDNFWAQNIFVLLQLFCSSISIYLLGLISRFYIPKINPVIVVFLYLIGPFLVLYDNYGLSDSFSISFVIFGIYFFTRFLSENITTKKIVFLLLSSLFLAWSFFIRQLGILAYGAFGLYFLIQLIRTQNIQYIKYGLLYLFIAVTAVSVWWGRNVKSSYAETTLVAPIYECFDSYPEYQTILRKLPIAWGGRFTLWGEEAEWFLRDRMKEEDFPFSSRIYASAYNYDSLLFLRRASLRLYYEKEMLTTIEQENIKQYIIQSSTKYLACYKKEKPLDYYFVNRLILLKKFIFTKGVKLPFPTLNEMTLIEKAYKVFGILFTIFIIISGLIGSLLFLDKRNIYLNIFIWLFVFVIAIYFGWIEFRYWATIYPVLVLFSAKLITSSFDFFLNKKEK